MPAYRICGMTDGRSGKNGPGVQRIVFSYAGGRDFRFHIKKSRTDRFRSVKRTALLFDAQRIIVISALFVCQAQGKKSVIFIRTLGLRLSKEIQKITDHFSDWNAACPSSFSSFASSRGKPCFAVYRIYLSEQQTVGMSGLSAFSSSAFSVLSENGIKEEIVSAGTLPKIF